MGGEVGGEQPLAPLNACAQVLDALAALEQVGSVSPSR
jgi:hypothetical protein